MRKAYLAALALLCSISTYSQDSLLVKSFKMMSEERSDRVKDSIADAIIPIFTDMLKSKSPENFSFSEIPHLGIVESPDKAFRIYGYNILYKDGTARHFGYIQKPRDGGFEVIYLNDKRDEFKIPIMEENDANKWYGALYYQIVPVKADGKTFYTLIGNSYNDLFTTRKVADIMDFRADGVHFGEPLFFDGRSTASRIVFEYSARVSMTLKYFADIKYIVFDHLVSSESGSRDFQFFGPDGSQDGFTFEKGMWTLKQNIDFKQPKQKKEKKQFKVSNY